MLASCGDTLVKIFFAAETLFTPDRGGAIAPLQSAVIVELNGGDSKNILEVLSHVLSAVEPIGARGVIVDRGAFP